MRFAPFESELAHRRITVCQIQVYHVAPEATGPRLAVDGDRARTDEVAEIPDGPAGVRSGLRIRHPP